MKQVIDWFLSLSLIEAYFVYLLILILLVIGMFYVEIRRTRKREKEIQDKLFQRYRRNDD